MCVNSIFSKIYFITAHVTVIGCNYNLSLFQDFIMNANA
nr:MAG TPA: hypothetical protein [Caudoviricetes sp.]